MQATLCISTLHPPAVSLHCSPITLHRHFRRCNHDNNFLALRPISTFSYGGQRAVARARAISSTSSPDPSVPNSHKKALASMAGTAVITVALACGVGCIFPSWRQSRRTGLAASWYSIPIQSSGDRSRPDPKSEIAPREQQQIDANKVLREMFARKDLPENFHKVTPNYPMIKEYFKKHLRFSDPAWETLSSKWKEIKPGPDQIDIGLLLVDFCIIKGNVAEASYIIDTVIIKNAPDSDSRPKVRMAVIDMIKDYERKNESEKKIAWEEFLKKMEEISNKPLSFEPEVK